MTEKQLVDFLRWLQASHYNESVDDYWLEIDLEYAPQIAAHYLCQEFLNHHNHGNEVPTAVNSKPDNQRKYVRVTNGGTFHGCIGELGGIDSDNGMSRLIINGREVYMNHTEWEFVEKC